MSCGSSSRGLPECREEKHTKGALGEVKIGQRWVSPGGRKSPPRLPQAELWLHARRGAFSRENRAAYISCVFLL